MLLLNTDSVIEKLEKTITDKISEVCKQILFFCETKLQSTIITVIHYLIFIIGIYYFYFVAKPKSLYKKVFFLFCLFAFISFLIFDKCLCSSIEYKLHNDKNFIQEFMGANFGDGELGKTVSKSNLLMISLFLGLSLIYDYRICNNIRKRK